MVQLILEQLVNGMPSTSISPNITSQAALDMPGVRVIVQELPSINFIQSCWMILQIIGETLAAYCIGKAEQWYQLFSDSTGRRQTDIYNLVIDVIDEKHLRLLILSTSIILKRETSDKQVEAVLQTISGCGKRLQRWEEVLNN